jgi:hypothetical protein
MFAWIQLQEKDLPGPSLNNPTPTDDSYGNLFTDANHLHEKDLLASDVKEFLFQSYFQDILSTSWPHTYMLLIA